VIEMGTAGIVLAHGLVQGAEMGGRVQEGMIVKVLSDLLFSLPYKVHPPGLLLVPTVVIISITMLSCSG
jgi:hypothetical protein